jgi:hypothetical protein
MPRGPGYRHATARPRSGRLDEEFIRRLAQTLAHPGNIDHGVDQDIGDMDTARPEIARDRFRQNTLSRLGRGEAGKIRLARGLRKCCR